MLHHRSCFSDSIRYAEYRLQSILIHNIVIVICLYFNLCVLTPVRLCKLGMHKFKKNVLIYNLNLKRSFNHFLFLPQAVWPWPSSSSSM